MDIMQGDDEFERKPSFITEECKKMLKEATAYIAEKSSERQAEIMIAQFKKIVSILETMPGIGSKYGNEMRRFLLGKFPYYIYYTEYESYISIRGIWHTSRGTEFLPK
jgi:plasmid stabilization system protein ParE